MKEYGKTLKSKIKNQKSKKELLSVSEFRREVDLPLVVVRKMVASGHLKATETSEGTPQIHATEIGRTKKLLKNPWKRFRLFTKTLGPGIITGASDDDPSGIGTYSSVGAKFGFSILWMAVWLLPMMLAIQEVCARIGIVTNKGLAGVLQKHYRKSIVMVAVILLIVANIVNIGADLGAMADALSMLTGINFYVGAFGFAILIILMEIFVGYHIYVKFLKWLSISVLAYVIAGFMIHPEWKTIIWEVFTPGIKFTKEYIFAMVAVFGTTITPYLFFWQTSEEVEENRACPANSGKRLLHNRIHKMRTDVGAGMILANVVFFFIVLTTAQVLFRNGFTNIETAQQAAQALKPFSEGLAYLIFAIGIIGTGLLAVPILAGSGAYALAEIMKWHEGLELKFSKAKGFYLVIASSIIIGLLLNFFHISPITALYYAAYLNGIIALPLLVIIMVVGNDPKIMGKETHPTWVKIFGWLAVVFMIVAVSASIIVSFI